MRECMLIAHMFMRMDCMLHVILLYLIAPFEDKNSGISVRGVILRDL